MERLLTPKQVAEHLGMHCKTLYKGLRENRIGLKFIRIHGRRIGFRPKDVEAFLEAREVNPTGIVIRKRRKMTLEEKLTKKYGKFRVMTEQEAQQFFEGLVSPESVKEPGEEF